MNRGLRAQSWPFWGVFESYGGKWWDEKHRPTANTPEGIAACDMYATQLRDYGPPDTLQVNWYECATHLQRGDTAMCYDATGWFPVLEDPKKTEFAGKFGYARFPAGPVASKPCVWNWCLGINSTTDRPNASWLFVQWATSKVVNLATTRLGAPGARISVWEDPEVLKFFDQTIFHGEPYSDAVLFTMKNGIVLPILRGGWDMYDNVSMSYQSVITREKTAKEAMDTLNNQLTALFKKMGYIK